MPAIVLTALRYLIIGAVQLGVFTAIERWVLPLLNSAISEIMQLFGVDESTAEDILGNEYLEMAEAVGITAAVIASRTPLKVADRLGFRTRGVSKKTLKPSTAAKVTAAKSASVGAARAAVSKLDTAAKWSQIALGVLGLPVGTGLLITNTIDFGAWPSSAYQSTVQNFLAKFGLKPDENARQPRTTSQEVFNKIYTALKNQGVKTLSDPYKQQTVLFSRDTLLDLTDRLAGGILVEGGAVNVKQLIAAILPLTDIRAGSIGAATVSTPKVSIPTPSVSKVKIFSGVMAQGVLGERVAFTERQDDLIASLDELTEAAQNNLAPWLAGLLGKVLYEVRLVNSVTTKDGIVLAGSTQQIISSYTSKGEPRYKTVRNRFAIMNLSILTDKGSKIKLATITLGPTDALKLQPTLEQLSKLTSELGKQVITSKVEEIQTIATVAPLSVTTPTLILSAAAQAPTSLPQPTVAPVVAVASLPQVQTVATPAPVVPAPVPQIPAWKRSQTLSEFYSLTNRSLPPLSERARLYGNYGLGQSEWYTGTAEQNTKLLNYMLSHYSPD